jgi:xanthine dehydrogenase accessory factor
MMSEALSRRARELAEQGTAFVTATVVRAQKPTSVEAGSAALVLDDGTIEGFVGGVCAESSVRAYSLQVLATGEPVLLRIVPDMAEGEVDTDEGAVTVSNPCLSGGAIEVFLEPSLPAPRVLVVGDTPIADALRRLGPELGLELAAGLEPEADDLAVIVASHGRDELQALRRGLEADVPYVALVASDKRGAGVVAELGADGVAAEQLERIEVPAGLAIGARTPSEIALAILARVVAVRRGADTAQPAPLAVDPICGMTVAAVPGTLSIEHEGETVYFCGQGCLAAFGAQHEHAAAE